MLGAGVSDNPITTPSVVKENSFHDSTNVHFQYETEEKLCAQLRMEYGNAEKQGESLVAFVESMVAKQAMGTSNALLLGSGCGLTSFLLTRTFEKIVGVDYSGRFIDAVLAIQSGKEVVFGGSRDVARLPQSEGLDATRVIFKQMTWVPNELEGYDVVIVDFLERLAEPKGWLVKLWECLEPQGIAIIADASGKWHQPRLQGYIGRWFNFVEGGVAGEKSVTVWKLK